MRRARRWLVVPALLVLIGVMAMRSMAPDPCLGSVREVDERPTMVVVMFDDLDVELAKAMPTWPDLASRGATFGHAFVTTPLCCPSRASFLTGQYARTHGVVSNTPPRGGYARAFELGLEDCALPVWLDRAGYDTVMIGRHLNGHPPFTTEQRPPGWDDWQALHGGRYHGYRLDDNGSVGRPDRYSTDELADRAVQALRADREAPLYLQITPTAPHTPIDVVARHADAKAPPNVDEGRYRLMLAGMDLVDAVLSAAPSNAYVIVTSDNGFHTEPEWGKAMPWDSDTRVPLVVIGPGIAPGVRTELVANIDLAPTIASWAGVEPPSSVEGRSLASLLRGNSPDWRESLRLELVDVWSAVRTADDLTITWGDGRVERLYLGNPSRDR